MTGLGTVLVSGNTENAVLGLTLVASAWALIAFCLFFYVLVIIAFWKMFTKAGEKGWKSIIPIYNVYVAFRLTWKDGTKHFWIFLLTSIIGAVMASLGGVDPLTGAKTTESTNLAFLIIALVAIIISLIWFIRFCLHQAHAYNKGAGVGILTVLFPNIMTLYLGFAETARYIGPQD